MCLNCITNVNFKDCITIEVVSVKKNQLIKEFECFEELKVDNDLVSHLHQVSG
jgi:hypothetical protein